VAILFFSWLGQAAAAVLPGLNFRIDIRRRSNEFGYANYQIMPKAPNTLVTLPKGVGSQTEDKTPSPGVAD
jgi:hypothetical protein